jgi:dTMP kinase
MTRSPLAGEGIRRAKEGNNLGRVTQSLFYATDFVDRLENEIVPALRSGFIVLTDRYVYSLMARAFVRGMDSKWIRSIYSVALKPNATFYLRLSIDQLIPRVVFSRGFDYWESGMDLYPGRDMYDCFCNYQTALLAEFDRLSEEYKFDVIEASADAEHVFERLKAGIFHVLEADSRKEYISALETKTISISAPGGNGKPAPVSPTTNGSDFEVILRSIMAHAANGNGKTAYSHK